MPSFAKELMLKELMNTLKSKNYIFFARYQNLPATEFVELRRKLDKAGNKTVVVKNTLTRLAFKQMGITDINGLIKGSIVLAVTEKDPQILSKILVEFAKGRENFQLDGAYLEGKLFPAQYLKSLADLPSREVLLATVLSRMNGPIGGFVSVLGQMVRSLVTVLDQIQKQKGPEGGTNS